MANKTLILDAFDRAQWAAIQRVLAGGLQDDGMPGDLTRAAVAQALGIELADGGVIPDAPSGQRSTERAPAPDYSQVPAPIGSPGRALIKHFESCLKRLSGGQIAAYLDPVGIPTIGWGSIRDMETGEPIKMGRRIDQGTADRWMELELDKDSRKVRDLVSVELEAHERDALVSFAYNCGSGALAGSTLLRKLNRGDREGAAKEFGRWVNAKGQRLPGLVRRRMAEAHLFRTGRLELFQGGIR